MSKIFASIVALSLLMINTRVSILASGSSAGEIELPVALADVLAAMEEEEAAEVFDDSLLVDAVSNAVIETWLEDQDGNRLDTTVEYETAIDESFALHASFEEAVDRLALPFEEKDSAIFRSKLYAELEGKRLIRFFDSAAIGEGCQALVTLQPELGELEVYFINSSSREHTFRLTLTDEAGNPIDQEELSGKLYSGELKTLSEEQLETLLADPDTEVEILSVQTVISGETASDPEEGDNSSQPESGTTPTDPEQPGEPEDADTPSDSEKPGEPEEPKMPEEPEEPSPPSEPEESAPPADPDEVEPRSVPDDSESPDEPNPDESYYLGANDVNIPEFDDINSGSDGDSSGSGDNSSFHSDGDEGFGPDDGEKPSPDDGEKPGPDDGEKPDPDDGEKPDPDDGEKPDPDDGEKPDPDDGEEPGPDDGEGPDPDDGEGPDPDDGEQPDPDDGEGPDPDDGEEPGPDDGEEPDPDDGEEPDPDDGEEPDPDDGEKPEEEEPELTTTTVSEGVVVQQADAMGNAVAAANSLMQRTWSVPPGWKTNAIHVRTLVTGGSRGGSFTYEITDQDGKYVANVLKNGRTHNLTNGRITVTQDETFTVKGWGWPFESFNIKQISSPASCDLVRVVLDGRVYDPDEGVTDAWGLPGDGATAVFVNASVGFRGLDGDIRLWKRATADPEQSPGDNLYDMELIAAGRSGASTPTSPVNVVLIVDQSASMTMRWNYTRSAVSRMVLDILDDSAHDHSKVAVVGYNHGAAVKAGWTGKQGGKQLAEELNRWSLGATGPSNWSDGFKAANTLLGSADKNALQYIIFLSDGDPMDVLDLVDGQTAARELNRNHPQARILSVGIGRSPSESVLNPSDEWRYQDSYATASSTQDILDAFAGFTGISKQVIEEPVIVDILSEHVAFADEEPIFQYWYCNEGGEEHVHGEQCGWQRLGNTGELRRNGKSITWILPSLQESGTPTLEDWTGYRLTYKVKAIGEGSDYPDTGQEDTGTHAGELGWRSNEHAGLLIGGEKGMAVADFPHPVVRAERAPMPTASLRIIKYGDALGTANEWLSERLQKVRFELRDTKTGEAAELPLTDRNGTVTQAFAEPGEWALYETDIGPNSGYSLRTEQLAVITVDQDGKLTVGETAEAVEWNTRTNTLRVFNPTVPPSTLNIVKLGDAGGSGKVEDGEYLKGVQFRLKGIGLTAGITPEATGADGRVGVPLAKLGSWGLYETSIGPNDGYELRDERLAVITIGKSGTILVTKIADGVDWDAETNTLFVFNQPVPPPTLNIVKLGDPMGEGNVEDCIPLEGVKFQLRGTRLAADILPDATDANGTITLPMGEAGTWWMYETSIGPNDGYKLRTERLAVITVDDNGVINAKNLANPGVDWHAETNTIQVIDPPAPSRDLNIVKLGDAGGNGDEADLEPLERVRFRLQGIGRTASMTLGRTDAEGLTTQTLEKQGSWWLYETDLGPNTGYKLRTERLATITMGSDGVIKVTTHAQDVDWNAATGTLQVVNKPVPSRTLKIIKLGDPVGNGNDEDFEPLEGVPFQLKGIGFTADINPDTTDADGAASAMLAKHGSWGLYETALGPNTGYELRTERLAVIRIGKNGAIQADKLAEGVDWNSTTNTLRVLNQPVPKTDPLQIMALGDARVSRMANGWEPLQGVLYELRGVDAQGDLTPAATDENGMTSQIFPGPGTWALYESDLGPAGSHKPRTDCLATVTVDPRGNIVIAEPAQGVVWDAPANTLRVFHEPAARSDPMQIVALGDPTGGQLVDENCVPLPGALYELRAIDAEGDLTPAAADEHGVTFQTFPGPGIWALHETSVGHVMAYEQFAGQIAVITVSESGEIAVTETEGMVRWDEKSLTLRVYHRPRSSGGPSGRNLIVEKVLAPGTPAELLQKSPATFELRRGGALYATGTASEPGNVIWVRNGQFLDPAKVSIPTGPYTVQETDPGDSLVFASSAIAGAESGSASGNLVEFVVIESESIDPIRITFTNRERAATETSLTIEASLTPDAVISGDSATFHYEITGSKMPSSQLATITLTPQQPTGKAVVSGLALGERYTVTALAHDGYIVVSDDVWVADNLGENETAQFVYRNAGGYNNPHTFDHVVIKKVADRNPDFPFTIRLRDNLGNEHRYSLRNGESTEPIHDLLYDVPYTVDEVDIPANYRLASVKINGVETNTFTMTPERNEFDIVVTNTYHAPSSSFDRGSGGSGGGSSTRDTDPKRGGTVISDERVPKTPVPGNEDNELDEFGLADGALADAIPNTGGFPLEVLGLCGIAAIGGAMWIRRRK